MTEPEEVIVKPVWHDSEELADANCYSSVSWALDSMDAGLYNAMKGANPLDLRTFRCDLRFLNLDVIRWYRFREQINRQMKFVEQPWEYLITHYLEEGSRPIVTRVIVRVRHCRSEPGPNSDEANPWKTRPPTKLDHTSVPC